MDTYIHLYPLVLNYGGRRSLGVGLGVWGGAGFWWKNLRGKGEILVEKCEGLTL